jgi:hypothetical protein
MAALVASLTLLVQSCGLGDDDDGETSFSISGTVSDSLTGIGLDSAGVAISNEQIIAVFTDSTGRFEYTSWGGGTHRVFAMKEGYTSKSRLVNLSADPKDVDFQLVPE